MRPLQNLRSFDEALTLLLGAVRPVEGTETVTLEAAWGRVTAEDVVSPLDVPPFDRAAMDGYAVRAADVAGAATESAVRLRCVGVLFAGSVAEVEVTPGTCVEIATGAPIPAGADAVVMVEDTHKRDQEVAVMCAVRPGQHTTRRAADIARGEVVVPEGSVLTPARVGAVAAAGHGSVRVYRRPRVAVGATGNELVEPGGAVGPGQIYNVNSYSLGALLESLGCRVHRLAPCPDDEGIIRARIAAAVLDNDLVILSGGSSVGDRDLLQDAMGALGRIVFHGIAIKPGKPTLLAMVGECPVLGMPGYPTSCLSNGYVLLAPAVDRMARRGTSGRNRATVPLASTLVSPVDKHQVMTVRLVDGVATQAFKESGVITSMSQADGFVEIPVGVSRLDAGTRVEVILL